jgi:N6-L-threonylcarbamoyladenine synthase
MAGCLSVGSNMAKGLAAALCKPLVGVHHMVCILFSISSSVMIMSILQQAHALTPLLTQPMEDLPRFPFLALLVSGGHTLLLLAISLTSFRTLASTADESIGRAFDKVSRHLCLKWTEHGPGAALERFCAQEDDEESRSIDVPQMAIPVPGQLMFSFSGLHSTVERYIFSRGGIQQLDTATRRALARSFQTGAVAQLEEKICLGFRWCERRDVKIRHMVVSGGVASNSFLRAR